MEIMLNKKGSEKCVTPAAICNQISGRKKTQTTSAILYLLEVKKRNNNKKTNSNASILTPTR
jgi:hypothetical protein